MEIRSDLEAFRRQRRRATGSRSDENRTESTDSRRSQEAANVAVIVSAHSPGPLQAFSCSMV